MSTDVDAASVNIGLVILLAGPVIVLGTVAIATVRYGAYPDPEPNRAYVAFYVLGVVLFVVGGLLAH